MLKTTSRSLRIFACATIAFTAAISQSAHAEPADLLGFLSNQGCVIGPPTLTAARDAGFEDAAIDQLIEEHDGTPAAVKAGQWVILPADECTIQPPVTSGELHLTDPEVVQAFVWQDAMDEDPPGCFLERDALFQNLENTRGWDGDQSTAEYLKLLGAGLVSGDIAFYSDSPIKTPRGFQLMTGECAKIPNREQIRASHEFLTAHFDSLIRENAQYVDCNNDRSLMTFELAEYIMKLTGGQMPNAWTGFELEIIAMGGGWFDNISQTTKGTPRPPTCHQS